MNQLCCDDSVSRFIVSLATQSVVYGAVVLESPWILEMQNLWPHPYSLNWNLHFYKISNDFSAHCSLKSAVRVYRSSTHDPSLVISSAYKSTL